MHLKWVLILSMIKSMTMKLIDESTHQTMELMKKSLPVPGYIRYLKYARRTSVSEAVSETK